MLNKRLNVTAAMLAILSGSALMAQPQQGAKEVEVAPDGRPVSQEAAARTPELVPSDWLIGQRVQDRDGKRLGKIKDLILDAGDGHIVYALVDRSPYQDGGSPTPVAVPWLALNWNGLDRVLTLPISRDRLAEARVFDVKRWDLLDDRTWVEETYGYFDVHEDAYREGWSEYPTDRDAGNDEARNPADPGADDRRAVDPAHAPDPDDLARDADDHDPAHDAVDGSLDHPRVAHYALAERIKGQTLRGAEDKEIGDVDELVFDAVSGRMGFIVAEFGGFLGIGDSKVAVPWDYFKVNDDGHLYTNEVRADEVRTAPRIEKSDWSELRDPEFGPRVYKHFDRNPAWFKGRFGPSISDTTGAGADERDDGRRTDKR